MSKVKVVLVSDSPYATTGLGRLTRYFLKMFPDFYWYIWGTHHPTHVNSPTKVKPVYNKNDYSAEFEIISPAQFGHEYAFEFLPEYLKQVKPDYFLTCIDFDRLASVFDEIKKTQLITKFTWVNYYPLDRQKMLSLEKRFFQLPDINIGITKHAQNWATEIGVKGVGQIYHPIDASEFPFISKKDKEEFRVKYFGENYKDNFIVGSVNRSTWRKDPARTIQAFAEFYKNNPDSMLYMHGSRKTFQGADLYEIAVNFDLTSKQIRFPEGLHETYGFNKQALNNVYSTFDVFVTSSMGEGFGYTTVEALLTETPIIAPHNSSFPELIQDNGYLVDTVELVNTYNGNSQMWPIANTQQIVDKLQHIKDNSEEAKEKAKLGKEWVKKNLNLKTIEKQWRKILK